ncbi:MAG TPA: hypothetical protein VMW10_03770 [Alphaproteobacteria bacterium]|nr:hypothetical protein [Alphaproteobacteria bacterium]
MNNYLLGSLVAAICLFMVEEVQSQQSLGACGPAAGACPGKLDCVPYISGQITTQKTVCCPHGNVIACDDKCCPAGQTCVLDSLGQNTYHCGTPQQQ